MSMNQLDDLIQSVQADPQHIKLLQILVPQLERLVNIGSPDFRVFLTGLKEEGLILEDEARELKPYSQANWMLLLITWLNESRPKCWTRPHSIFNTFVQANGSTPGRSSRPCRYLTGRHLFDTTKAFH
ncbi:hypothetical protein BJX66DRAFT_119975 [Aspergillus keveii]|uniref:Uncharacterized protein n=1 Tax=Aspergillus keveii TaxID=714993 RepID=A0ABR4FK39_9EURO